MKRRKAVVASNDSQISILEGTIVDLPVQKLAILTPRKKDTVRYFGRQGTAELFKTLVDSKVGKDPFNVSFIGHPGAGKSNLVWAVAHHLVTEKKETVLWASRRDVEAKWELRLFEHDGKTANVYELEDAPEKLSDILKETLLNDLSVLILDAPTVSGRMIDKSNCLRVDI
jgi:predicted ATP-dependent serine protease